MSTYSQIYIQIVFGVKHRDGLISAKWEDELYKYITGIIQQKGQKVLAINGTTDHVHILIGMKPTCNLTDLVREFKKASSVFIREKGFCPFKFEWQEGYGAFSYSQSALGNVIRYIDNQKEHHKKTSFKQEYLDFLERFHVDFKTEYLPKFIEDEVG